MLALCSTCHRRPQSDAERLEGLVKAAVYLLVAAPAVHSTACGARSRRVWIAVGRTRSRGDYTVWLFTRPRCLARFRESVYCVLPVASNVHFEIQANSCVVWWVSRLGQAGGRSGRSAATGDCYIDAIQDNCGLLRCLHDGYVKSCSLGLTFHEQRRTHFRELYNYRYAIPIDLQNMTLDSANFTSRERCQTMGERRMQTVPSMTDQSHLLCLTWNVGATSPRIGWEDSLAPLLEKFPETDLICLGMQETCLLGPKRVIHDGDEWISWKNWAQEGVQVAFNDELELLHSVHLVGLLMLVFTKKSLRDSISQVCDCTISTGVIGIGGNKGAACVRFELQGDTFCFVNAHLASGQERMIERCQSYRNIVDRMYFVADADGAVSHRSVHVSRSKNVIDEALLTDAAASRDSWGIWDHDHIFWLGDVNSRLHCPDGLGGMAPAEAARLLDANNLEALMALDQLNLMRRENMAFQGFTEHPIMFEPSYKWIKDQDALLVTSRKQLPAWTDRIMFRSRVKSAPKVAAYDMFKGLKQSDHRMVYAHFFVSRHQKYKHRASTDLQLD